MFNWKVEDLILFNQKGGFFIGKEKIYNCENELSREEKIEFVDNMQNGKLSYLLNLIEKFNQEKDSLKSDNWGRVKTVSLKAWIKKNDSLHVVDDWYKYGKFTFLGLERYIQDPSEKGRFDTYTDIVDELFHRQLKECESMEKRHFLDNDEYSILKRHIKEKHNEYGTAFGTYLGFSSDGEVYIYSEDDDYKSREITLEELKELSNKYAQLDELVEKITLDTNIKY